MRLIDADEVKECFRWSEVCRLSISEINKIIDNAPSKNPCDNCDLYFKATTKEIDRWYKKEEQKGGAT